MEGPRPCGPEKLLPQSHVAFTVGRKPRKWYNDKARTVISHSGSQLHDEWGILKQAEVFSIDGTGRHGATEEESFLAQQGEKPTSLEHVLETHAGARDTCEVGMDKRRLKIAMLLSGGVDSSVALALLHAAGHKVTAFYLQIWFQEDFRNSWDACPWEEDLQYCTAVCDALNVPLKTVHLSSEYWDRVVDHSIAEVKAGRTPNPDMLCNSRVKFGAFYEYLDREYGDEFDRIASGHYARVQRGDNYDDTKMVLTPDAVKDQTYFLANLKPEQLHKAMFPLGCFTKPQVRELAMYANLPNTSRKDSQGICFLGKVKFDEFIREHIGEWPGPLVEEESDSVIGYHAGYWFYTVGQRKGIHLSGGPWYVTKKDVRNNAVYISRHYNTTTTTGGHGGLIASRSRFCCVDINWLGPMRPQSQRIQCKVRHGPHMYDCTIYEKGMNELTIELDGVDQGLASGQYAVLYEDSVCLGCGTIMHDDSYVSRSAK